MDRHKHGCSAAASLWPRPHLLGPGLRLKLDFKTARPAFAFVVNAYFGGEVPQSEDRGVSGLFWGILLL